MGFYSHQRRLRINIKNILFYILVPGMFVLFFIYTEKAFIEDFQKQFPIIGPGEALFIFIHTTLVYFLGPILWVLNFFIFFRFWFARTVAYTLQVELVNILANISYAVLLLMMLGRIFYE